MKNLLITGLLLASCNPMMPIKMNSEFDKQGHRGCRAMMPENTIPAMITAMDLGVATLELDVVVTKDKQILVSHEPFFNHEISTRPGGAFVTAEEERSLNIYEMTFAETTQFDVGLKPHPRFPLQKKIKVSKPLLSDLIDQVEVYCNNKKIKPPCYNIETKSLPETDNIYHPAPPEFIRLLMDMVDNKKISSRVIIQSFDVRTLQELHAQHPAIKTALLIDENNGSGFDHNIQILGFIPTIYSPHHSHVTSQLIERCHQKGIRIIPWTVNDKNQIIKLKRSGVDGIITDDPTLFN